MTSPVQRRRRSIAGPPAPARRPVSWLKVGVVLLLVAAAMACAAVVALQALRVRGLEAFQAAAGRLGAEAQAGDVGVRWDGRVEVRDAGIRLQSVDGLTRLEAGAALTTARWRWVDILQGEKRPTHIDVRGARFQIEAPALSNIAELAQTVLGRLRQQRRDQTAILGSERRLPSLTLMDSTADVRLGDHTARVTLTRMDWGQVESGDWGFTARGNVTVDGHSSSVELAARIRLAGERAWAIRLALDAPLQWMLASPLGPVAATVTGLESDSSGRVSILGVHVALPEKSADISIGALDLQWAEWPRLESLALPTTIRVRDGRVQVAQGTAAWQQLDVSFYPYHASLPWRQWLTIPESVVTPLQALDVTSLVLHTNTPNASASIAQARVELDASETASTLSRIRRIHAMHPVLQLSVADDALAMPEDLWSPDEALPDDEETVTRSKRGKDEGEAFEPRSSLPAGPSTTPTPQERWLATLAHIEPYAGVSIDIRDGELALHSTTGGERMGVKGLDFRWEPATADRGPRVEATARLNEGVDGKAALRMSAELDPQGAVKTITAGTTGPRLAKLLPELSPHLRAHDDAELSLDVRIDRETPDRYRTSASVLAQGVGFHWWRIAHDPVDDIELELELDGMYEVGADRWQGRFPLLRFGEIKLSAEVDVARVTEVPHLKLHLKQPTQPCDRAFRSIPPALVPRLAGLRAQGTAWFDLKLDVNLEQPDSLKLDLDGELETCQVIDMGERVDLSMLSSRKFVHRPIVEGEVLDVAVGPGTKWWVPLTEIPEYVSMAAVATEDLDFFVHNGFKLSLIKRAIKLDLDRKRYVYGGSTISQQLVKNLFLSREKTLARKIEEAIITWQMEHAIPKERILELYLNCIEFGPEIYGIKMASLHYFGKQPRDLTPLEGAFLMGNKPCPSCGYRQWQKGGVDDRWYSRMRHIMKRLRDRGWISAEQFDAESDFLPHFYYPDRGHIVPEGPRPRSQSWR